MASKPIYQMYAELQEYEPKIWRRFYVANDITMAKLAYILMTLFEMKGSHLYLFEVDELNNFIINNLEYYNKNLEEFKDDDFFKIGQYGCIFEDYEMYCNWLGTKELDLNKFDLEDLNFRLKKLPRIFKESYEYGLEPTERSIKILERDYNK